MMKLCLAAAVIVASASAQKLPTPPPPPPYDGNYPPPPPRPTQDACTSDAQCPLPCPMGQSGACRPQWGAGRTCQCVSQGMPPPPPDGNYPPPPPMHPVDPIMPPAPPMHPIDPLPAPGGTSRCWTSTDGKSTQYTNGYPGSGWTLGCAPAPPPAPMPAPMPMPMPMPPPPPGNYPNHDAPSAADGARCGGFMEATTLSPRCMCGDSACAWATGGWTCNCPNVAPAPAPARVDQQACLSCVSMSFYYGENGLCRPSTGDFPMDGFRMCHDYGRGRTVECCASLAAPAPPPPPPMDGNYPRPPAPAPAPATMCPAGTMLSPGGRDCISCPAGMYQGMMGQTTCLPCAPGTFNAFTGSTVCTMCPSGRFSMMTGTTDCTMCPMDTFSLPGQMTCTACAQGETAPVGSSACMKGH